MIIKKPLFCNLSSKRDTNKPKYITEQKTEIVYALLLYALICVITKLRWSLKSILGVLATRCGRKTIITQRWISWVIDSIDLSCCFLLAWYAPWHVAHFEPSSSKRIKSWIRCRYVWTSCQGFTPRTFLAFPVEPRIWKVQHISSWQHFISHSSYGL